MLEFGKRWGAFSSLSLPGIFDPLDLCCSCLRSPSPVPIRARLSKETIPSLGLLRHIPAKPKGLGAPRQGACQGFDPRHVSHPESSLNSSRLVKQCCPFPPCPPSGGNPSPLSAARIPSLQEGFLTPAPLDGSGGICGIFTCKKVKFPNVKCPSKPRKSGGKSAGVLGRGSLLLPLNFLLASIPLGAAFPWDCGAQRVPHPHFHCWMGRVAGSFALPGAPGKGEEDG